MDKQANDTIYTLNERLFMTTSIQANNEIPFEQAAQLRSMLLDKSYDEKILSTLGTEHAELSEKLPLVRKIASQCDSEEFHNWLVTKDLPLLKLTNAEMEAAQGGLAPIVIFGLGMLIGAAVGAAVIAASR
ncbi:MAG: hypothetical protein JKY86_07550 [Gammaproteobacteria bacterium]|nr:hypothetical protein [Gammaproteobacteria bacterium]